MLNLSLKSFVLLFAILLSGSLIHIPLALALDNDSDTDSSHGCSLYLYLDVASIVSDQVKDLMTTQSQGQGYKLVPTNWSRPYRSRYDRPTESADFRLFVRTTYEDGSYRSRDTKVSVVATLERSEDETIWIKQNSGSFSCVQWKGWKAQYEDISESWWVVLSGTYNGIWQWNNRCDGSKDPYEFARERFLQVLTKQLKELPTCEAAKKLPRVRGSE